MAQGAALKALLFKVMDKLKLDEDAALTFVLDHAHKVLASLDAKVETALADVEADEAKLKAPVVAPTAPAEPVVAEPVTEPVTAPVVEAPVAATDTDAAKE